MQRAIEIALAVLGGYLAAGLGFASFFLTKGAGRTDRAALGSPVSFRLLIAPGVVALWPLLAARWRAAAAGRQVLGGVHRPLPAAGLRRAHRRIVFGIAGIVPFVTVLALGLRPAAPARVASVPVEALGAGEGLPFAPLPIRLRIVADAAEERRVEIEVTRDLELPGLVLLWAPEDDGARELRRTVCLGPVWGPHALRYALPESARTTAGSLVLYSLAHREKLGTVAVPAPRAG